MEEQVKQQQSLSIFFNEDESVFYPDVQGYQIGGGVVVVTLEEGKQVFYNLNNVRKMVKSVSIVKE